MRKFTKEISALLAATAMGASVCVASAAEPSENIYRTDGVATMSDREIQPSTIIERTAGEAMPEDLIEPSEDPTEEFPPTAGVLTTRYDEEYFPPEDGVAMPEDYYIQPTTLEPTEAPTQEPTPIGTYMYEEPTEEIPPMVGDPMPPDETIEPTEEFPPLAGDVIEPPIETTAPTIPPIGGVTTRHDEETPAATEEDFPPLAGLLPSPSLSGDADVNGVVELADVVTVSKHVMNKTVFPLKNETAEANADMNRDGDVDGLDVSMLIEDQLGNL